MWQYRPGAIRLELPGGGVGRDRAIQSEQQQIEQAQQLPINGGHHAIHLIGGQQELSADLEKFKTIGLLGAIEAPSLSDPAFQQ